MDKLLIALLAIDYVFWTITSIADIVITAKFNKDIVYRQYEEHLNKETVWWIVVTFGLLVIIISYLTR